MPTQKKHGFDQETALVSARSIDWNCRQGLHLASGDERKSALGADSR